MSDRRTSPTPPHNTREFSTFADFAKAAKDALSDYPKSDEGEEVVRMLEESEEIFRNWTRDASSRPAPTDRLPYTNAFWAARGRAIDLLTRLAKAHPEVATAALARHREAARRARDGR